MRTKLHCLIIALALLAGIHHATAQGTTAFTYQGQLHDNGTNANGTYGMIFKLYDASTSGTQVGSSINTSATLANGLFSVNLDFGVGPFNGDGRWLEITITNGGNQTLSPRVQMLATPYAQFAAVAATVTNNAINNPKLAINAVADTNIQNSAVTDAKIVSVSGNKVVGAVATATGLSNGLWIINNNSGFLVFSNSGTWRMGFDPAGGGEAGGDWTVDGKLYANHDAHIFGSLTVDGIVVAGSFNNPSDRNLKENFAAVSPQAVLAKVVALPISTWNFKADQHQQHLGPMAQDFYAAFKVGPDDRHIATVDEGGVALAAIQGLNEKLKSEGARKDAQIKALENRLAELEQLVNKSVQK